MVKVRFRVLGLGLRFLGLGFSLVLGLVLRLGLVLWLGVRVVFRV